MSIDLPSQVINSGKAFFRRPAQPVFKILPDFDITVQIVLVYRFLYHKVHYTGPPPSGQTKKALSKTGLRPRISLIVSRTNEESPPKGGFYPPQADKYQETVKLALSAVERAM